MCTRIVDAYVIKENGATLNPTVTAANVHHTERCANEILQRCYDCFANDPQNPERGYDSSVAFREAWLAASIKIDMGETVPGLQDQRDALSAIRIARLFVVPKEAKYENPNRPSQGRGGAAPAPASDKKESLLDLSKNKDGGPKNETLRAHWNSAKSAHDWPKVALIESLMEGNAPSPASEQSVNAAANTLPSLDRPHGGGAVLTARSGHR